MCGKTGTAQKFIDGQYSNQKYVASFVGFAPKKNPEIAVLVVVDEPIRNRHHGGTAAAPAFREIVNATLNYMTVQPDQTDNLLIVSANTRESK